MKVHRVPPSPFLQTKETSFSSHKLSRRDAYPENKRRDPEAIPTLAQTASKYKYVKSKVGQKTAQHGSRVHRSNDRVEKKTFYLYTSTPHLNWT